MNNPPLKYLSGSLWRHVFVSAIAGSMGLLALFASDFIDIYFIGMLGVPFLAASVGYAATITFFTTSLSIGLAIGTGVLVGRFLGARESARASEVGLASMVVALLISLMLVTILAVCAPYLLRMLGAQGEVFALALSFLRVLLCGLPFMSMAVVMSAMLRAQGAQTAAATVTMSGALINVCLDPLLMFVLGMGFIGAAWATVLSQVGMFAMALYRLQKSDLPLQTRSPHHASLVSMARAAVRQHGRSMWTYAFPAILANLATPFGNAYLTRTMSTYGNDAVAGFAVIARLTPIAFAFVFAMSGAIGPIIAQNLGAKQMSRVRETMRASYGISAMIVLGVSLVLYLSTPLLLAQFPMGEQGQRLVKLFCGPISLLWLFNAWLFCANATFNNLGKPMYSTLCNWARQTIFTIPFTMVCAYYWHAQGVIAGPAIGGIVLGSFALWLSFRVLKEHPNHV